MGGDVLADAIFGRKWDQSWDGCDQPPAALSVGPSSNLACIWFIKAAILRWEGVSWYTHPSTRSVTALSLQISASTPLVWSIRSPIPNHTRDINNTARDWNQLSRSQPNTGSNIATSAMSILSISRFPEDGNSPDDEHGSRWKRAKCPASRPGSPLSPS